MVKLTTDGPLPLWKRIVQAFVVCAIFLVIIIVGFLLFKVVYEQPPEDMIKISDQFAPGRSWRLIDSRIEPVRIICIDAECPSVRKVWKTESLLTRSELLDVLRSSGWRLRIDGTCVFDTPNIFSDSNEVCSATGDVDGYNVSLSVTTSNPAGNYRVGLNISRRG